MGGEGRRRSYPGVQLVDRDMVVESMDGMFVEISSYQPTWLDAMVRAPARINFPKQSSNDSISRM